MAHPYGGGEEGRWQERWRERDDRGFDERYGRQESSPGSERRWAEHPERRYGGEEGWQGEYGRDYGSRERGGSEREGYGDRPYGRGEWYGRSERDERYAPWERERGPWQGRERWVASESGRRWPGGVTGAEAGQPYGRGFFGTAYALYAGQSEREGERLRPGRGPKGYRRSDERIHDEVCERIARAGVDADEVEVKVENGEVTLSGSVHRRDEKRWLEDLAEDVLGVQEVHNHLRVARGEQTGTQGQQTQTSWPRH